MSSPCPPFIISGKEKNMPVGQGQMNLDAYGNKTVDKELDQREINVNPSKIIWYKCISSRNWLVSTPNDPPWNVSEFL